MRQTIYNQANYNPAIRNQIVEVQVPRNETWRIISLHATPHPNSIAVITVEVNRTVRWQHVFEFSAYGITIDDHLPAGSVIRILNEPLGTGTLPFWVGLYVDRLPAAA